MTAPQALTVRDACLDDLEILASWYEALALESEGLRLDPETIRAGLRAVLEDRSKGLYFVAEAGGVAVGMMLLTYEWSDWRNGLFYWIQRRRSWLTL